MGSKSIPCHPKVKMKRDIPPSHQSIDINHVPTHFKQRPPADSSPSRSCFFLQIKRFFAASMASWAFFEASSKHLPLSSLCSLRKLINYLTSSDSHLYIYISVQGYIATFYLAFFLAYHTLSFWHLP